MQDLHGNPLKNSNNIAILNRLRPLQLLVSAVWLISISLILLISPNTGAATPTQQKLMIVYQKSHGFSQQLIEYLQQDLSESGFQVQQTMLKSDQLDLVNLKEQQLLITVGSKTTEKLLNAKLQTPILSILMPRHIANSLRKLYPHRKNWSTLLIDQPIERQLHLIDATIGQHKKTGVLLGPYTRDLKQTLNKLAIKKKHLIATEQIDNADQLSASLKALSHSTNVLLTLPDPAIYNKSTIRGFLLLAYRKRIPIIGFSQAYVKAGAIAAIYSKPDQISKQVVNITRYFFSNGSFKYNKYYPDNFSIALNKNVARSLGIKLTAEKAIIKHIKIAEASK